MAATFAKPSESTRPLAKSSNSQISPVCLTALPDEVLQHVIAYLTPKEVLERVQVLSRQFHRLASDPLIWKHHCKVEFRYWDPKHQIKQKFSGEIAKVDWKGIFRYRTRLDARTTGAFEGILAFQTSRIVKFDFIKDLGYDAKDTLLRHCNPPADAQDILARQYYAYAVLDHIHRFVALSEWRKISRGLNVPIERALGAYDMFVLHDQPGDFEEISGFLDDITTCIRERHPGIDNQSTREKALITVRFLRQNDLVGLSSELAYRDMQNNFIGIALQDENHPSLPLISTAIFCAVARRLGLDAACCAIPNHVHAIITPPKGKHLDLRPIRSGEDEVELMFLDPYRFDEEVPLANIRIILSQYGIEPERFEDYITDTGNVNLILRTSRNILATVQELRAQALTHTSTGHPTIQLHPFNPYSDLDNAFYAALWANYMFSGPSSQTTSARSRLDFIQLILERFEGIYPMDISLIEEFIMPECSSGSMSLHLRKALRLVRAADQSKKTRRPRGPGTKVRYRVGQVFQHRRYAYMGIITGWDLQCDMDPAWIAENDVDRLSRGRSQSFYNAIIEDTSARYVAEENIEIIQPDMPPESLVTLAGKYFKRWDRENHVFVSNIRDEYPHD